MCLFIRKDTMYKAVYAIAGGKGDHYFIDKPSGEINKLNKTSLSQTTRLPLSQVVIMPTKEGEQSV